MQQLLSMVFQMTKDTPLSKRAKATRLTSAGWHFQRLACVVERDMSARLAAHGLKIDHFVILMTLAERDNVTQTQLGEGISMPNYAITRALDFLEEAGLVERRKDAQSRRSHRVFLTQSGSDLMPKLFATVSEVNDAFLAPLTKDERASLAKLLVTLSASPDA